MAKKKSGNICTTLGCKTTSDSLLTIMLGVLLAVIVYFVAIKGNQDSINDSFAAIVPTVFGVIAIVTLVIILIEKLQKKITMAETGKKVVMTVVYLVLFSAGIAIAKVIANMFGLN
jgi:hypothetical protein